MQVVMKCFRENVPLIPKNDVRNHGFRKPETEFQLVNSLTVYWNSLAFGSMTSFFGIKGAFFAFFSKTT